MTTPNSDDKKKRARRGEGAIYWDDEKNCYRGAVSLGYTPSGKRRRKVVYGTTKAAVRDKFKKLRDELEQGVESSPKYTVAEAVNAWLERGLVGRDPKTVAKNRHLADAHVIPGLGAAKLRDLTLEQVEDWLHDEKGGLATSTLKSCLSVLIRSIRHAQRHKKIAYNVAELATVPKGRVGRPSKAMILEFAMKVLEACKRSRISAYFVVSLMTGVRTEEARALRWKRVHLKVEKGNSANVEVWRSVRAHGDTKTEKSRRSLALPDFAIQALIAHKAAQEVEKEKAKVWVDDDLVFCTTKGGELDAANVRRSLRQALHAAGLPTNWTPRELRHSFVSIMSAEGASSELIAKLVGHATTKTTELVYRKELRPVITGGAELIGAAFDQKRTSQPPVLEQAAGEGRRRRAEPVGHLLGHPG